MANKPITEGPGGETIFHRGFASLRPNELPILFKQVEDLHDHRLLALVTALIVEDRLDKLLAAFCPRYKRRSFNYARKIEMLEALSLIPYKITDACKIVGSIRNSFAHNLDHTNYADVAEETFREAMALLKGVKEDWGNESASEEAFSTNFRNLSFFVIVGLDSYYTNILKLRQKISTPEFISSLQREAREELDRGFKESRERGAKFAVRNGKKWAVYYDAFADIVDELPAGVPVVEEKLFAALVQQAIAASSLKPKSTRPRKK